jgi:glycosyltransferase involved in cell wall biosynthesis
LPVEPTITVAIPTYNGSRHLSGTLRSILAQAGAAFELIVSDDRSDDETIAHARDLAGDRARIVVNSERLGLAGNWNRCVDLSQTPWVAVFHQDDIMLPGHLAAHVAAFSNEPTPGMVCGAAVVIDDQGIDIPGTVVERGDLGPVDRLYPAGGFVAELLGSNPVRCSTVTLNKAAHAGLGGFDPSYRFAVDWEFWLRLARTWSVVWHARPSVAVRWHPASEAQRFKIGIDDLDEVAQLLDRAISIDGVRDPSIRRRADRRLARAYLNRAHDAARLADPSLTRRCLRRAVRQWPGIVGAIARDPRLAARLAVSALSWPRA